MWKLRHRSNRGNQPTVSDTAWAKRFTELHVMLSTLHVVALLSQNDTSSFISVCIMESFVGTVGTCPLCRQNVSGCLGKYPQARSCPRRGSARWSSAPGPHHNQNHGEKTKNRRNLLMPKLLVIYTNTKNQLQMNWQNAPHAPETGKICQNARCHTSSCQWITLQQNSHRWFRGSKKQGPGRTWNCPWQIISHQISHFWPFVCPSHTRLTLGGSSLCLSFLFLSWLASKGLNNLRFASTLGTTWAWQRSKDSLADREL